MADVSDILRAIRGVAPRRLAKSLARTPLVLEAELQLLSLPQAELADITGELTFQASLAPEDSRHAWSLGAGEQFVLQALVAARGITNAFEIGTFNGGTTRLLAEALPDNGRVVTMDLPPVAFDAHQTPRDFVGNQVGRAYQSSPCSHKVTQILEDSLSFDASPYANGFDLVLVDGGHEYVHGVADTHTALRLVAPGGIILWDDFHPHWHGLVRGICDAMRGRALARLAGTSLAVHVDPSTV